MEDIYIILLRKAKKDFEEDKWINKTQFLEFVDPLMPKFTADKTFLWNQIYAPNPSSGTDYRCISLEAYFKLLDYDKLQHARKDSRDTKSIVIITFIISALLSFIQIVCK